jgi:CheY-like chemotaxis protein
MAIKVLVFESDAAFAGELRTELGKLGCTTHIVDDGNVGLQQAVSDRPDLILLSIELPRMNGFSVCNKLKKDASLKDVPLIIMSSESSDETFEQHRKLRTRAEDYVHKPIAFGELLQHIQPFIALGEVVGDGGADNGQIYIDDDVVVDDDDSHTQVGRMPDFAAEARPVSAAPPPKSVAPKKPIDADVDAFADAAFGRITQSKMPPAIPATNGTQSMEQTVATRISDMPLPHDDANSARAKEQVRELERQLSAVKSENARLQDSLQNAVQPEEHERLQREVEDLRTRLASSGKGGAVSSREFLDLRENLNKKDKEILSLRETLGRKDKEVVESRERSLEFARAKGDADDRILAVEREIADGRDKIDALTADKEQAKKASEDFRSRMTRAQADLEVRVKEVDELRAKYAEEISANEAGITALHAEHAAALSEALERVALEHQTTRQRELDEIRSSLTGQIEQARDAHTRELDGARAAHASELAQTHATHSNDLDHARSSHASELTALEERRRAELTKATEEGDNALSEALERATRDKSQAVGKREEEMREQYASDLAVLKAEHQDELGRARSDFSRELEAAKNTHAQELGDSEERRLEEVETTKQQGRDRLAARERELAAENASVVGALERARDERIATIEHDRDERIATIEHDRDERIATIEHDRDERLAAIERERDERIATIERERDELVQALDRDRAEKIEALEAAHDLRIADMKTEHEATLSSVVREHTEKLATLENDRDARLAAIEARLAREVGDALASASDAKSAADTLIASLTRDLDDAREQLSAITKTKRENDTNNGVKIAALEDQLATATVARDSAERDLNAMRDRVAVADAESIELRADLGRTREQLAAESARADRAFSKWESDRGSLERAKDALAVALSQIEEAEARS